MFEEINRFYEEFRFNFRVDFNREINTSFPIICFKNNNYRRGVIAYVPEENSDFILIYDVDSNNHTYVEKRNIFNILKLFFEVKK